MKEFYKDSVKTSYLIGLPIGLGFILIVLLKFTYDNETNANFVLEFMGFSILALIVGFIFSIPKAAKVAVNSILNKNNLIITSMKFCFMVNGVMWSSFAVTQIISDSGPSVFLRVPFIGFILGWALSTISIGMIISYQIKKTIKKNQR